jgi:hypothetical protein
MRLKKKKNLKIISIVYMIFILSGFINAQKVSDAYYLSKITSQPDYDDIIDREIEWILEQQIDMPSKNSDGAILMFRSSGEKSKVVPYFSNFAAMGLLARPENDWNVIMYMDWYFRHLNFPDYNGVNGSVYDYWVYPNGNEEVVKINDKEHYDSIDSYASTFLVLLKKYYEVTDDADYLVDHRDLIEIIANAIVNLQQSDGLTWAMPDYKIKYLMDNSEVYEGFSAIEWITRNIFNDEQKAAFWAERKEAVANGIENKLWQNDKNIYKYYYYTNGTTQWTTFYPDATAQLFPISNGLIDQNSERAIYLYNSFNQYFPGWSVLNTGDAFPWAIIAFQASIMKDTTNVNKFLNTITGRFLDKGNPYPWYCAEAGHTISAAEKMIAITAEIEEQNELTACFHLFQNYPNPFNPGTSIIVRFKSSTRAKVVVYNSLGQVVKILADARFDPGTHNFYFDGTNLTSGLYFCRVLSDNGAKSIKMLLLK